MADSAAVAKVAPTGSSMSAMVTLTTNLVVFIEAGGSTIVAPTTRTHRSDVPTMGRLNVAVLIPTQPTTTVSSMVNLASVVWPSVTIVIVERPPTTNLLIEAPHAVNHQLKV
ncbi:hypothetical protein GUJ93_ZPchr0008g13800 [Zizania palustris]|uniref:Uncharacterized protein n=1 Tax=Zizania palustris TaxID=103762 RepID=A0A8J5RCA1_ZIZPA|nr:hypothetical protein GUJ93_ZPchr0008g13800 [Zizania palustris]